MDVYYLGIKPHLAFSFKKDIDLFENRMDMPVTSLFSGFVRVRGEADDFSHDLVINDTSSRACCVGPKTSDKVSPGREWAKLSDAE
ncbi:MAG: hypothetical protein RIE23_06890 [Pontimonas sp.]